MVGWGVRKGGRAGPKLLSCLGTSLAAEAAAKGTLAWQPVTAPLLFTLISDLPENFHLPAPQA